MNSNVDWSEKLIIAFKDYWGWKEICSNHAVHWTYNMIEQLEDYIDFISLSTNRNVEWSEELIMKYYNKWNWAALSGNENLPWSYEFIKKYESYWVWNAGRYFYHSNFHKHDSLCTNTGIDWNDKMISEWLDKLDFWGIARYCGITDDLVLKYQDKFYQEEVVGATFHKFSDWNYTEDFDCTGWENLGLNPKFKISPLLISYLYGKTINRCITVGKTARDMDGKRIKLDLLRIVISGSVVFNSPSSSYSRWIQRISYSTEIENLLLKDLIDNELTWTKYFISENHIHESVWIKIIKPIFTKYYLEMYLTNLKDIIDYRRNIMVSIDTLNKDKKV